MVKALGPQVPLASEQKLAVLFDKIMLGEKLKGYLQRLDFTYTSFEIFPEIAKAMLEFINIVETEFTEYKEFENLFKSIKEKIEILDFVDADN